MERQIRGVSSVGYTPLTAVESWVIPLYHPYPIIQTQTRGITYPESGRADGCGPSLPLEFNP